MRIEQNIIKLYILRGLLWFMISMPIIVVFFQSNSEAEIINKIHEANQKASAILINAAAFTHTSIAIFDALSMFQGTIIEIHITNIHSREEFRHKSFISNVAYGIIAGFGFKSYEFAIEAIKHKLDKDRE